jgi:glycyl-tRNA synthetase beta chain
VIRPRFSDAEFFWNQDRKQPLAARHGSAQARGVSSNGWVRLADKSERVAATGAVHR